MNDLKKVLLAVVVIFICALKPLAAQPITTPSGNVDLVNRLRLITKENDRLKNIVETYEANLSKLEEEHSKTTQTIKQLQDQLTQGCSNSSSGNEDVDRLVKELVDTHYNLGVIYQQQQKFDEAEMEYRKVLEVKPDDADALYNLAIIYDSHKNDSDQALLYYQKYLDSNPSPLDKTLVEDMMKRLKRP
jgi:tetratricopeptide (TPR) repeat protein